MSEFMDIGKKVHQILGTEKVNDLQNARRCPKCGGLTVEIIDLRRPNAGTRTGIFCCLNGACPVDCFDPTLPEVTL